MKFKLVFILSLISNLMLSCLNAMVVDEVNPINQKLIQEQHLLVRLNTAALNGYVDEARSILQTHPDIINKFLMHEINGNTNFTVPFASACKSGHLAIVELFVNAGMSVNFRPSIYCNTPLMDATLNDHINVVKFLLSQNANVTAKKFIQSCKDAEGVIFYKTQTVFDIANGDEEFEAILKARSCPSLFLVIKE